MKQPSSDYLLTIANDLVLSNQGITTEQFLEFFEKCEFWAYEWGMFFADGNDLHLHILTNYRKKVFLRAPMRLVAREMFSKYDVVKTSTLKNKPWALLFELKVGWRIVEEKQDKWILEIKKTDFKYA